MKTRSKSQQVDVALVETREQRRRNSKRGHTDVELESEVLPTAKRARKESKTKSIAAKTRADQSTVGAPYRSPDKQEVIGKTDSFLTDLIETISNFSTNHLSSKKASSDTHLNSDVTVGDKLRFFVNCLGKAVVEPHPDKSVDQKILSFPEGVCIGGTLDFLKGRFLVRKCYNELFRIIWDMSQSTTKLMIQGNPGIGKSLFAFFVMNELVKMGRTVVWQPANFNLAVCIKNNKVYFCKELGKFVKELTQPDTWYIVDSKPPEYWDATTLFVCSPDQDTSAEYVKHGPARFFMPVWEWKELEAALSSKVPLSQKDPVLEADVVKKRYDRWGGIPRYVFQFANFDDQQVLLPQAINHLDIRNLSHFLGNTRGDDASHKVIHLTVDNSTEKPFTKFTMDFASLYVRDQIVDQLRIYNRDHIAQFIDATKNISPMAGLRGLVFESYAHIMLAAGGTFRVRKLSEKKSSKDAYDLAFSHSEVRYFDDVEEVLYSDCLYYQPYVQNFAGVDAMAFTSSLFQMTVSEKHPIKKKGIENVVKHMMTEHVRARQTPGGEHLGPLPTEFRLYFVVPRDKFKEFVLQSYLTKKETVAKSLLNFAPHSVELVQYVLEL